MVDMVSNSADANAHLFKKSEKVGMDDVESAICLALLNDARNVDLASTWRVVRSGLRWCYCSEWHIPCEIISMLILLLPSTLKNLPLIPIMFLSCFPTKLTMAMSGTMSMAPNSPRSLTAPWRSLSWILYSSSPPPLRSADSECRAMETWTSEEEMRSTDKCQRSKMLKMFIKKP